MKEIEIAKAGSGGILFDIDYQGARQIKASLPEAVGHVFNVGGSERISLAELAQLLVEANGGGRIEHRMFPEERKRIDIGDYYADDSRIKEALGWGPRIGLSEGLARTLAYYRLCLPHYV